MAKDGQKNPKTNNHIGKVGSFRTDYNSLVETLFKIDFLFGEFLLPLFASIPHRKLLTEIIQFFLEPIITVYTRLKRRHVSK